MKKGLLVPVIFILIVSSCNVDTDNKIISLNIRYDNPRDGDNAWPARKEIVLSFLEDQQADMFGLQEVLWHQYAWLDSCLAGYSSVAAGRDDGLQKGEMTPVFFKSNRFDLLDSNTFWLSETPDVPGSKGWGAVLPRIVSWIKLEDKRSKEILYFFNTHYSHMSDSARLMSSKILSEQLQKIAGKENFVVTGDFNMLAESEAYKTMVSAGDSLIKDSYYLSDTEPAGEAYTFNGFKNVSGSGRIDYIFVRSGTRVKSHQTVNLKRDGIFISDHWPVISTISLKR
ncbi:MAG: endonuclease/exonuclease/phosphatase family protein [Bacteroidales bacterium]|nr:endonuclease/exonuclease/phosphatase family protein [Bacteroidales bacterium]